MSGACYTRHAMARAKERYGLDLTADDFQAILDDCTSGRAPCLRLVENIGRIHAVRFKGDVLVVAIAADKPLIKTLMPPDYFCAGASRARGLSRGIGKQKPRKTASATNPIYSRASHKRDAIWDEEGEE
jgi:hypothetical protein